MKQKSLLKTMLLLFALIAGSSSVWADDPVTLVSGSGTSGYAVPTGWSSSGTVEGGSYLKFDNGTITSPSFAPHNSLSFAYTVATFGSGTDHPLTIRILNASTNAVIKEESTATPTSSTYINTDSPINLGDIDVNFKIQLYAPTGKGVRLRNYSVTGIPVGGDPSSSVTFATATPSLDLKNAPTYTQTATTASGYSTTPGASVTYSIGATNTALATINTTTGEVTPTQAGSVVVEATAAAIDGHFSASFASYTLTVTDTREFTVTCHTGNTSSDVVRTSGATLSLDNPAAICGMDFVGWSSTENIASPTWVANTTKVTGDMELWAMYEEVAGEYSYRLVESNQADWRGDYLIAYSSTIFADGRVGGTSGMGAKGASVNPSTNLSGKVVAASWGDTYNVTIVAKNDEKLSDGYLMKTKDGKYNYQTSNANGLAATDTKATAANYPLSITYNSSSDIDIAISAGAVFHYNTGDDGYFRFYKDGGQSNVYLYKRTEDAAPVYSLGLTAKITLNAACTDGAGNYYGTYSSSSAFVVPSDLVVSEISVVDGKLYVDSYNTGDVVPANTGVMVAALAGGNYDVNLSAEAGTSVLGNDNMLKPSGDAGIDAEAMATAASGCKYYRLTMHNGTTLGFYWGAASGAAFALGANKAYLAVPAGTSAPSFFEFGGDVTGIEAMETSKTVENGEYYNLAGQRVANPTKGLYIVNGKKVVIK